MLAEKQVPVLDLTNPTITSEADLQTAFHSLNLCSMEKGRSLIWQKVILYRRRHPLILYHSESSDEKVNQHLRTS